MKKLRMCKIMSNGGGYYNLNNDYSVTLIHKMKDNANDNSMKNTIIFRVF